MTDEFTQIDNNLAVATAEYIEINNNSSVATDEIDPEQLKALPPGILPDSRNKHSEAAKIRNKVFFQRKSVSFYKFLAKRFVFIRNSLYICTCLQLVDYDAHRGGQSY